MDVFEAMETCRAMRYFKPDPVPAEMVERILHAATRAPSPGNSQGWDFVVVTEAATKQKLADAIGAVIAPVIAQIEQDAGGADADPVTRRMLKGAGNLARKLAEVPVIVLVCGRAVYPPQAPEDIYVWSTLYPAAQNILLAARALGLGSCFTTFQNLCGDEIRALLGIPADVRMAAFIPIGWPDAPFGPLARRPLESFVHRERW